MTSDEAKQANEEEKVQEAIDAFFEALDEQDLEAVSDLIAHDAEMVHFGTDEAERWVGWTHLKGSTEEMFETLESYAVSTSDQVIKVAASGEVAWFSQVVDTQVETQQEDVTTEGARFTGVLEKRQGNWVFVQSHLSLPVSGQHVAY